ncbi:MAG: YfhO family protein, partial [Oscillospiraceae bacterium]|nr:YfhO family protein [Oscillospiraceae bacterium]
MSRPFFNDSLRGALKSFFWALFLACCIFVPLMVYNRGYFLFLGDFNVQQIPFYRLAHEAVKSGNVFWNWHTDLGANFIGSYSFYLLFSPFFWLTLPFPTEFVPHLMAPLLILKTACAALTSYYYIKRFVNEAKWAVIGSVLYAFSGFMTFNIFFNHFHEVCVFFPLLLIALEELVENDRRGFFALMVALNCMVNYWFFIGEVVFVVLYVCLRSTSRDWKMTFGRFCAIAWESVLGLGLAM